LLSDHCIGRQRLQDDELWYRRGSECASGLVLEHRPDRCQQLHDHDLQHGHHRSDRVCHLHAHQPDCSEQLQDDELRHCDDGSDFGGSVHACDRECGEQLHGYDMRHHDGERAHSCFGMHASGGQRRQQLSSDDLRNPSREHTGRRLRPFGPDGSEQLHHDDLRHHVDDQRARGELHTFGPDGGEQLHHDHLLDEQRSQRSGGNLYGFGADAREQLCDDRVPGRDHNRANRRCNMHSSCGFPRQ
jgi:hypothetical protein